jgi:hypothetical protein
LSSDTQDLPAKPGHLTKIIRIDHLARRRTEAISMDARLFLRFQVILATILKTPA